jgi:hypothetical protein
MATVDFDDLFGSDGDRGHLAVPPRPFHSPPICISMAVTSRGRPIKFIPKLTELACAELARRALDQDGKWRRSKIASPPACHGASPKRSFTALRGAHSGPGKDRHSSGIGAPAGIPRARSVIREYVPELGYRTCAVRRVPGSAASCARNLRVPMGSMRPLPSITQPYSRRAACGVT